MPNDNTNVSCPLPLSFTFTRADSEYTIVNITLSPLDKPEDVEQKLSESLEYAGVATKIHIAGEFFGNQDSQEVGVRFLFIILTPFGERFRHVPEITIDSDQSMFDCVNLNNETDPIDENLLNVRAELNTIQNQTFPDNFKIGYENLNIRPGMRFTNNFPIDVMADRLQEDISDLYGWGCRNTSNDQLQQQVTVYQPYENMDSGGANGVLDPTTSFCGQGSLRTPRVVWIGSRGSSIQVSDNSQLYVSST